MLNERFKLSEHQEKDAQMKPTRYHGHTITGPSGWLGVYSISGPLVTGSSSTVDECKRMIRNEEARCVNCAHGSHKATCSDSRAYGKLSNSRKDGRDQCGCTEYRARQDPTEAERERVMQAAEAERTRRMQATADVLAFWWRK